MLSKGLVTLHLQRSGFLNILGGHRKIEIDRFVGGGAGGVFGKRARGRGYAGKAKRGE
jgi:hypothetical protein